MIDEKRIESSIEKLDDPSLFDNLSKRLIEEQPFIIAYLESEGFGILTPEEKDLLWYCLMVIYDSVDAPDLMLTEMIQESEDANYEKAGENVKFSEMADRLFDGYEEEDLLAFVEDTLVPDEEDFITPVGRKVLFISLKTMIDVLV